MRRAPGDEVSAAALYGVLALRVAVFVAEQECPYQELDGRDLDPTTVHLWHGPDDAPEGYLRLLGVDGSPVRIGRVCVARHARGAGLASGLMATALAETRDRDHVLDAQSHLVPWYRRFGFRESGFEFREDGIPHTPMVRTASGC